MKVEIKEVEKYDKNFEFHCLVKNEFGEVLLATKRDNKEHIYLSFLSNPANPPMTENVNYFKEKYTMVEKGFSVTLTQ